MVRRFASFCVLLSAIGLSVTAEAEDSLEPERNGFTPRPYAESGGLHPLAGRVVLEIRSALVGPAKDDGKPWDGLGWGRRPGVIEITEKPTLANQFLRVIKAGASAYAMAAVAPWAIGAASQATAAPDVQLEVFVSTGARPPVPILVAPKIQDKFIPSWIGVQTPPLIMRPDLHISIRATDIDLERHDAIGACRIDGVPLVDEHNYVSHDSLHCESQLLSVAIYAKSIE